MKFNRFYPKHATLGLLMFSLMATTSIQAQTSQAQASREASAAQFEASIYPKKGDSPAIKVSFNNLVGGSIRLLIQNQNGNTLYDEHVSISEYRRCFDLSSMPAGEYTVQLSKNNKQYTQTFVIDAPLERHIALKSEPTQSTDKNLAVKQ